MIAHDVFLENTVVEGNVNAKRVTIGNNVIVKGKIEFTESFTSLKGMEYQTSKIDHSELLYIDTKELCYSLGILIVFQLCQYQSAIAPSHQQDEQPLHSPWS